MASEHFSNLAKVLMYIHLHSHSSQKYQTKTTEKSKRFDRTNTNITPADSRANYGNGVCVKNSYRRSCEIQSKPNPELFDTVLVWMRSENFIHVHDVYITLLEIIYHREYTNEMDSINMMEKPSLQRA